MNNIATGPQFSSPVISPPGQSHRQFYRLLIALLAAMTMAVLVASPVHAQELESFDPDEAYAEPAEKADDDLAKREARAKERLQWGVPEIPGEPQPVPDRVAGSPEVITGTAPGYEQDAVTYADNAAGAQSEGEAAPQWADPSSGASVVEPDASAELVTNDAATYAEDDLIGAAEGVFGKGAEGLAKLIQDLLKKEGQPNGYIVGREAGGAFVVGARYGSGTLHHKIEGERQVYWTGPSVGFDAGANAGNTFVLVYNLFDTEDLYKRFPAGEGQAYFVGGLNVSYVRSGDVVLIPIRVGAGLRLGVNAGYMKFSKKQNWLPF